MPSSSGDLPNPGIKHLSPAMQADSLPSEPPGKPQGLQRFYVKIASSCLAIWQGSDCHPLRFRKSWPSNHTTWVGVRRGWTLAWGYLSPRNESSAGSGASWPQIQRVSPHSLCDGGGCLQPQLEDVPNGGWSKPPGNSGWARLGVQAVGKSPAICWAITLGLAEFYQWISLKLSGNHDAKRLMCGQSCRAGRKEPEK